jgi:cysteine synthase A
VKGYDAKICTYKPFLVGDSARLKITGAYGPDVYMCPLPSEDILRQCSNENERYASYIIAGKTHMYELERDNPDVVWVDQIYNPYNTIGQMEMGREIYRQLDGRIDAWGCSIGTGGAFLGVTLALKEAGVEPLTFGVSPSIHRGGTKIRKKLVKLFGLKKWQTEESINEKRVKLGYPDEMFEISSEEARYMANRLCREEGLYCGMSSGANVLVALKIAEKMKASQNVVTLIVDRRDRYLGEYPEDIYVV